MNIHHYNNTCYREKMLSQPEINLFTELDIGDRKIDLIHQNAVMMVGLTRAGKSCSFNWILRKQMIGKGDDIQAAYINITKDGAALGDQYTSVTLVPNSAEIDSQTTLIDMAGYGDSRNYVGVMGVSYFLKSVFERVKNVKFLIVFNEHVFFDSTGAGIIKTFQGFLNMFKPEALTQEIKSQLFDSVSLVVTRSKQPHMHSSYLNRVLTKLSQPKLKMLNKQLLNEFVAKMVKLNRIQAFQKAKPNLNPQKCSMLQRFDKMNWQYFKIHQLQDQIKKPIINIPFEADYKLLGADDQAALLQAIHQRIQTYTGFTLILKELISSLKTNWKNIVDSYTPASLPDNFMDSVLCFKSVFDSLQTFLAESDKYHSEDLIQQEVKVEYPRPTLVQAIRSVLDIYLIANQIGDQFGSFQQNMKNYSDLFAKFTDCIRPFCTNALEEKMILRLKYILKRGFREFSKFYEINPQRIIQVNQDMKDKCNSNIFDQSSNKFVENFVQIMRIDLLTRIFTTITGIEEYQELFNDYRNTYEYQNEGADARNQKELQFNEQSISINFVKADIHMKQGDKSKAATSFISLLRLLCSQSVLVSKLQSSNVYQSRLNDLYLMKLRVIEKLVNILVTFDAKKNSNAKDIAISLCKHANEIDEACQVYDLQLQDYPNNNAKRSEIYQNYAEYCIEWGRYQQAKVLLQKKLRLQNQNFQERTNTINAIYNLVEDTSRIVEDEKKNIQKLGVRLPEEDPHLQLILVDIETLLSKNKSMSISINTSAQDMSIIS